MSKSYAGNPPIDRIKEMMRDNGVTRLYLKYLSPNDNSKNQPYFGGSLDVLNILPVSSEISVEKPDSRKSTLRPSSARLKASIDFKWLDDAGRCFSAPHTKLIVYPQYPEVRFSGFLRGAEWSPAEYMDPGKLGRAPGRVLFLGVTPDNCVIGYLAPPDSTAAREAIHLALEATIAVFAELELAPPATPDSKAILLSKLLRIHRAGWFAGKALTNDGSFRKCNNPNCGGYTLEAELGIVPNGKSEPDFMGWEVKQYSTPVLTLMTPQPDMGDYSRLSVRDFIAKYGYPDRQGRPGRTNFGGIHRLEEQHHLTMLTLSLEGYSHSRPDKFDPDGGLVLVSNSGEIAAGWSFGKLLEHWNKKHNKAVYVPSESDTSNRAARCYKYGNLVHLGEGTSFTRLLRALIPGQLYYDPALKLVTLPDGRSETKTRHQFRMRFVDLSTLYRTWSSVDLLTTPN